MLHTRIPAAAIAVVGIADRILLVVVLMVFLGRIEGGGGDDLGMDFLEFSAGEEGIAAAFGKLAFGLVLPVDAAAILAAAVAELFVLDRRVNMLPEIIDQLRIAHPGRIVSDTHRFRVPGAAGTDLLVGRVRFLAGGVTGFGADDAGQLLEIGFDTPETTSSEIGYFNLRNL